MKTSVIKHKIKEIKFKIRHKLFVFERKWHCHLFFGRFYPKTTIYKRAFVVLLALLVLLPGALFYLRPSPTEAAWFDDSYAYRQKITFVHNAALTNASMRLTVSNTDALILAGKMQVDCDDSRFTDSNGKLLKYRLISDCNSASTVYDVIFPTVLNGTTLAYLYYGNPTAASMSDNSVPAGTTPTGSTTFATEEKGLAPVIAYNFDEGFGTIAHSTGSCATCSGTLTKMASPPASTSGWMDNGKLNKAINFDGLDDSVIVNELYSMNNWTDFSGCAWVKHNSVSTDDPIMDKYDWNDKGFILFRDDVSLASNRNDIYSVYVHDNTDSDNARLESNANTAGSTGTFHHVCFTMQLGNSSGLRLYVDGVEVPDSPVSLANIASINTPTYPFLIGKLYSNTAYFDGSLDEVRLYNYALTAAQVRTEYNRHASGVMGQDTFNSTITEGLVGYWKLDDGVNNPCTYGVDKSCDSSGNNNTGTWTNGAASSSGKFANAVNFDGNNDYIRVPHNVALDPTDESTYSAWIYPTSTGVFQDIMAKNDANVGPYYQKVFRITDSNTLQLATYNGTTSIFAASNAIPTANQWYHVAAVVKDNSYVKLYVNGNVVYSNNSVGNLLLPDTKDFTIGASLNTDAPNFPFNGKIDDVRIYNRALSSSEVASLYDWAPAPVGWWKLDENAGATANDSSGNGLTGTLTLGPVWSPGKIGPGLSFDGVDDTVSISHNNLQTPPVDITIELWVKLDRLCTQKGNNSNRLVYKTHGSAPWYAYQVYQLCDPTDRFQFEWLNNDATPQTFNQGSLGPGGGPLKNDVWYHIAAVKSGSNMYMYLNGVNNSQWVTNTASGTMYPATAILLLGGSTVNKSLDGTLDDVRIYNYARTPKQIVSDMNAGHPAVGSPVGYWKFDEGYGTTANNSGSGGTTLNGTLTLMDSPATYGSGWTNDGKLGKALNFDGRK